MERTTYGEQWSEQHTGRDGANNIQGVLEGTTPRTRWSKHNPGCNKRNNIHGALERTTYRSVPDGVNNIHGMV